MNPFQIKSLHCDNSQHLIYIIMVVTRQGIFSRIEEEYLVEWKKKNE